MWILKSFSIIFPEDGDVLKIFVLWYAVEHASIVLRLSLSWMKANMTEFRKLKVLVKIL